MNIKRNTPDLDHNDDLVSTTYRELATESAPDELSQSVLRLAVDEAKPRAARSNAWMRPMAWAATIGLSLAIVLELSEAPQPDLAVFDALGVTATEPSSKSRLQDSADFAKLPGTSEQHENAALERESDSANRSPLKEEEIVQVPATISAADEKKLKDVEMRQQEVGKVSKPDMSAAFEVENGDMSGDPFALVEPQLEDTPASARAMRAAPASALEADYATAEMAARERDPACDAQAVATPETWTACISELKEDGHNDAASSELEQLQQTFPDFDPR
jgi:hypothetical protein